MEGVGVEGLPTAGPAAVGRLLHCRRAADGGRSVAARWLGRVRRNSTCTDQCAGCPMLFRRPSDTPSGMGRAVARLSAVDLLLRRDVLISAAYNRQALLRALDRSARLNGPAIEAAMERLGLANSLRRLAGLPEKSAGDLASSASKQAEAARLKREVICLFFCFFVCCCCCCCCCCCWPLQRTNRHPHRTISMDGNRTI